MVTHLIKDRIAHPVVDGGFAPSLAAGANLDVSWERALLHFAVHCRPAEAGAVEHSSQAEDAICGFGVHGMSLHSVCLHDAPPDKVSAEIFPGNGADGLSLAIGGTGWGSGGVCRHKVLPGN